MIIRAAIFSNGRAEGPKDLLRLRLGFSPSKVAVGECGWSESPSFAYFDLSFRHRLRMKAFLCLLDDHTACIISKDLNLSWLCPASLPPLRASTFWYFLLALAESTEMVAP